MNIRINEEPRTVEDGLTVSALLASLDYDSAAVAVAINGDFVPRSAYADTAIEDGSEIEVVTARQGG